MAHLGIGLDLVLPSESTIRRTLASLDADGLDLRMARWMATRTGHIAGRRVIAIDGKSLRGGAAAGGAMPHLLAALDHGVGTGAGQRAVATKSNEIPALPLLLASFDLTGTVVTADALHCQRGTAKYITGRGGHYLLTVKNNQCATRRFDVSLNWTLSFGQSAAIGRWWAAGVVTRPSLVDGGSFDFSAHSVAGLEWRQCDFKTAVPVVTKAAYGLSDAGGSVLLLDKLSDQVAKHASRLGGSYAVMEDVAGRFMAENLAALPVENDVLMASWLAGMAKSCFIGLAGLDSTVQRRLKNGRAVSDLEREGLASVQAALDDLVTNPTYAQLCASAAAIRATPVLKLYRQEAWDDTFRAVARGVEDEVTPNEALAVVRDRLHHGGRGQRRRIASRTLLIKGLEFDHVIIANAQNFTDPRQLYVALSRARKPIVVVGASPRIQLRY